MSDLLNSVLFWSAEVVLITTVVLVVYVIGDLIRPRSGGIKRK